MNEGMNVCQRNIERMNECLLEELKDERKLAKGRAQAGHSRQSVPGSPRGSL